MNTQSRTLRTILRSRNDDLFQRTMSLVKKAEALLSHAPATFPSGTSHTAEHTSKVEDNASWILSDDCLSHLNDSEIALLILACHFHDLGMVGTDEQNMSSEGREGVRTDHAVSIGVRIVENWMKLGLQSEKEAQILAEVCRGHRPKKRPDGVADWSNIPEHRILSHGTLVRTRLLSAVVYAADELHLGEDRAPRFEQEWLQINSGSSPLHWERHQQISGPVLANGMLIFEVTVKTASDDEDIKRVLRKAFLAYRDLQTEIHRVIGDSVSLPTLSVEWIRSDLIRLLIGEELIDLRHRSVGELIDAVAVNLEGRISSETDLNELCNQTPSRPDDVHGSILNILEMWVTQAVVLKDADGRVRMNSKKAFESLTKLMRTADHVERARGHVERADHTAKLYQSATGAEYIHGYLYGVIQERFSVSLQAEPSDTPIRTVLNSSPTACHIVESVDVPASVLSKRDLLLFASAAGICFDLYSSAPLILDAQLRSAVRRLFVEVKERLPRFQRFIEEVALVGGLTPEQAFEALRADDADQVERRTGPDHGSVRIEYQTPQAKPEWQMLNLLYAGQRAGEQITFVNAPFAPFKLTGQGALEQTISSKSSEPYSLSVGPSKGRYSDFCLRATLDFEAGVACVIKATEIATAPDTSAMILRFPGLPEDGQKCGIKFLYPNLRVSDLQAFRQVNQYVKENDLDIEIEFEGRGRFGEIRSTKDQPFAFTELLESRVLDLLLQCDASLPVPWVVSDAVRKTFESGSVASLVTLISCLKEVPFRDKPAMTSLVLRLATASGKEFREEFLGFMDGFMEPPQISGGPVSQEDWDRIWRSHAHALRMEARFATSVNDLAEQIRVWGKDQDSELPLHFSGAEGGTSPHCRSVVNLTASKPIDRVWYVEFPIQLELRPTSQREQWEAESKYWEAVGDERRKALLDERLAESPTDSETPAK